MSLTNTGIGSFFFVRGDANLSMDMEVVFHRWGGEYGSIHVRKWTSIEVKHHRE
jgi:hypothetical protein